MSLELTEAETVMRISLFSLIWETVAQQMQKVSVMPDTTKYNCTHVKPALSIARCQLRTYRVHELQYVEESVVNCMSNVAD